MFGLYAGLHIVRIVVFAVMCLRGPNLPSDVGDLAACVALVYIGGDSVSEDLLSAEALLAAGAARVYDVVYIGGALVIEHLPSGEALDQQQQEQRPVPGGRPNARSFLSNVGRYAVGTAVVAWLVFEG